MAEREGKYGSIMAEIRQEQEKPHPPTVFSPIIPIKPPVPAGKRSDPAYIQKGIFLKKESIRIANERIATRADKTDFSDLMQALLEAWLQTPE